MFTEFLNFLFGNYLYFVFYILLFINILIIIVYLLSFLLSFYDKKNYKKRKEKEIKFIKYWLDKIQKTKIKDERKSLFFVTMPFISKKQKKAGLYCKLKNDSKKQMKKYFKKFIISLLIFIPLFSLYCNYDNYNIKKHEIILYNNKNDNYIIKQENNKIELKDVKESSNYLYIINDSKNIIYETREIIFPEILFKISIFISLIFFIIMKYISKVII